MTDITIPVLDRGYVRYRQHVGSDLTPVDMARASFAKAGQRWLDGPACTDCGRKLRGR